MTLAADPWATVVYTTGVGSLTVETGLTAADVEGKAMIIHNKDGGRIACALLQSGAPLDVGDGTLAAPALMAGGFVPYYTYAGNLAISGTVGPMTTVGTTQTFYYQLDGVDPLCSSGAGGAGNSCGIHIHAGRTCVDNALGHYYTRAVTTDPWTSIASAASRGQPAGEGGRRPLPQRLH